MVGKRGEISTNIKLDTTIIPILNHVRTPLHNQVEELETIQQLTDRKIILWDLLLNEQREKGSTKCIETK